MPEDALTLVYQASLTTMDNLASSTFSGYTTVSKTLAIYPASGALKQIFLHFNNTIVVQRGTADVSKHYAVRRKWRNWARHLDPANREATLDDYTTDNTVPVVDSQNKPPGQWQDAPGPNMVARQTKSLRVLSEWIVGGEYSYTPTLVEGLGGLYFFVVLDLTPAAYRMSMSPSFAITAEQAADILATPGNIGFLPHDAPWKTEADIADDAWLSRHTTWQDYSSYNNRLPQGGP